MNYSIIDELYDVYLNEPLYEALEQFDIYYKKFQSGGNHDLVSILQQFVAEQTLGISNAFVSNVDDNNKVDQIARETVAAFETVLPYVDYFINDFIYEGESYEEIKAYDITREPLKPHDLFNINLTFIEKAIDKYADVFFETFDSIKNLIQYVKNNNLLDELYKDGSWYQVNFEELISNLYDKARDKSVFEVHYDGVLLKDFTLFDMVKGNCSNISSLAFDKYRPQLNSSKQIRAEFGKLIFCKNLLMYYHSGIMPDKHGQVDWSMSESERFELMDDFNLLYSNTFDEAQFRSEQSNYICKPEVVASKYDIDLAKSVKIGNRMLFGIIINGSNPLSTFRDYKIPYLIHINIEDISNPCSNYEIQLNLLPQGIISQRLQLMRLDNWESEQPHKNIAKKLSTTTHIHLYNEFDLLRGKVNGSFDIAYNLDGHSTDFETSLRTFLDLLGLDATITNKIYNSTVKSINKHKTVLKSVET